MTRHLSDFASFPREHVVRRNIAIGTAFAERKKQATNIIYGADICFSYQLRGEGVYRNENSGVTFSFCPGTLRILPPNAPYARISFPGIHVDHFLTLPRGYYERLEEMDLVSPSHPVIDLGIRRDLIERHEQLTRRVREVSDLGLPRAVSEAFTHAVDLLLPRPTANQRWRATIARAAAVLGGDFQDAILIPELAAQLNMSCTNFRRIFTSYYGVSPNTYRIHKKLEAIKSVLLTDDLLIKEVADRFGYVDAYTFSRQFKTYTGVSPTVFRNRVL